MIILLHKRKVQRQTETLAAYNVRTKPKTNTQMEGYGLTNTTLFHLYHNGDLSVKKNRRIG